MIGVTVPLPSWYPPRRPSRRIALRNCLLGVAALVLLVILLAGCGEQDALTAAAPSTIAPTTPVTPTPAPPTGAIGPTDPTTGTQATPGTPQPAPSAAGGARAPQPIWPVSDTASARRLQREVDGGRQPWLLDPVEVATSYAGPGLGYSDPRATARGPGVVEVRDTGSSRTATVSLAQTVLRGDGGIWLVTGVQHR